MAYEETIEHEGVQIRIVADETPSSPSEWGDTGLFLVTSHRDCYIPEPGEKRVTDDADELVNRWKDTHWVFPLELYSHSGVHLSLAGEGNYPDRRWDVSRNGFVFASKKEWRLSASARKAAKSKVDEWNQYLGGDVWGYVIEEVDGVEGDSCWGFYGKDYCIGEAKEAAEHMAKKLKEEAVEKAEMECRDIVTA